MRSVIIRDFEISLSELFGVAVIILFIVVGSVFAMQTKEAKPFACSTRPSKLSLSDRALDATPVQANETLDKTTRELFRTNRDSQKQTKKDSERKIQELAKERKNLLLDEMKKNPESALKQVLSDTERSESRRLTSNCVETPTTVLGTVEIIHADYTNNTTAESYTLNMANNERINLHFAKDPKTKLQPGKELKISGYRLDNELLVDVSDEKSISVASKRQYPWQPAVAEAAPGDTTGPQQTIVLMVYFQNTTQPALTQASVNNTVFTEMNNYFQETSYNLISIPGTSVNWMQIPMNQTCDINTVAYDVRNAAIAKADPVVNFANYTRIVIVGNYGSGSCGWGGLGTVGKTTVSTADGNIRASVNWVDQAYMGSEKHEFGHNLGLYHAGFYNCGAVTLSTSGCTTDEYGDPYSPMGQSSTPAHLNAPEKELLGWISPANTQTVTASGTYTIEPLETTPTALKSIRIQRGNGQNTGYNYTYYEYRTATGSDAGLNANIYTGSLLHNFTNSYTLLLDATPPANRTTPALPVGGSFTDPETGTKVTAISKTPTALTLDVSLGKTDFSTPTISITSPAYDTNVKDSATITASASALSGIQKIDFYLDAASTPTFTATTLPYSYVVNTTSLADGYHTIRAVATDRSGESTGVTGNKSGTASTRIIVSNSSPTLTDSLVAGRTLNSGESLQTSNSQFRLIMQPDGNLVLYNASNQPVWFTATSGNNNSKLIMQPDGNLVLYNASNQPTWNTGTSGNSGDALIMQADGNLVIYATSSRPLWSRATGITPVLLRNQVLPARNTVRSSNGQFRLIMQPDGNLVIYDGSNQPVWNTGTFGNNGARLVLQPDANLVVYNASNQPVWNIATTGSFSDRLVMQPDGNLVLYDFLNRATWSRVTGRLR